MSNDLAWSSVDANKCKFSSPLRNNDVKIWTMGIVYYISSGQTIETIVTKYNFVAVQHS